MHCPHCGHKLPDDASFCTSCGNKIERIPASEAAPQPAPAPQSAPEAEQPAAPAPQAAPAQPAEQPAKPTGWQNSMAFRIVSLVLGIVLIVLGVVRIVGAAGCSRAPEPAATSAPEPTSEPAPTTEPEPTPAPEPTSTGTTQASFDESLVTTADGFLTLYGLTELDGEQILDVMDEYDYDQITQSNTTILTPDGSKYVCVVRVGKAEESVGFDELENLSAGGAGEAVWYDVYADGYSSISSALKDVGNLEFEEYSTASGGVECGIFTNTSGDSFLFGGYISDKGVAVMQVFNEKSIAAGSMSDFGTTIPEVYKNMVSATSLSKMIGKGSDIELE